VSKPIERESRNWPEGVAISLEELTRLRSEGERLHMRNSERVGTVLAGSHRTPFRGRGMEFAEVRGYQAGDDPRSIDWKVTARTGQVHTKLFHEERERPVLFLLDLSGSMRFGTRKCFKSVQAARLMALLGFAALAKGDRVGGVVIGDDTLSVFRALRSRRRWLAMLDKTAELSAPTASGELFPEQAACLGKAMRRILALSVPGCQVVIFSDFYDLNQEFETSFRLLARRTDLRVVHLFDPLEHDAPPKGNYRISNGRNLAEIDASIAKLRQSWGQQLASREKHLEDLCRSQQAAYFRASTADETSDLLTLGPASLVP